MFITVYFATLVMLVALAVLAYYVIIALSEWDIHRAMTKRYCRIYGIGTYNDFVREFIKYDWSYEGHDKSSIWDRNNGCKYHASIIEFNNVGMVMKTPWDLLRVKRFVKNYLKDVCPLYDWSEMK